MKIKKRTVRRIKKNKYGYRARSGGGGQQTSRRNISSSVLKKLIKYSKYNNSEYMEQLIVLFNLFDNKKNQKYTQQFSKSKYDDEFVKVITEQEQSPITKDDLIKLQNFIARSASSSSSSSSASSSSSSSASSLSSAFVVGGAVEEELDVCAICLGSLTGVLVDACPHHQFHRDCLKSWVDTRNFTCPTCRGVIAPNLILQLTNTPRTWFHVLITQLIPSRYLPIATLIGLFVLIVSIMLQLVTMPQTETINHIISTLWLISHFLSTIILWNIFHPY